VSAARGDAGGSQVVREFSAGGVAVRRFRGRPFAACIRVKDGTVLALPKGNIDRGESAVDAAVREVREEAGIDCEPVEKLQDVKYWYVRRGGARVFKVVSFFLLRWRSGKLVPQAGEVDAVEWVPLEDAPRLLAYRGEKEAAGAAMSRLDPSR
jgi:8-oxo-dGTP pyrophosphatase MutT (NUDIX family)